MTNPSNPAHRFEVAFEAFDRYFEEGPEMADFSDEGREDYVVITREAWVRMGKPRRVTVTVEPAR